MKDRYVEIVDKYCPKEDRLKNAIVAFVVGGVMGLLGQLIVFILENNFDIN